MERIKQALAQIGADARRGLTWVGGWAVLIVTFFIALFGGAAGVALWVWAAATIVEAGRELRERDERREQTDSGRQ